MPRSSRPDGTPPGQQRDAAEGAADPAADRADCERRAVALLARREHSRLELARKLASRGYDSALIAETLDGLEQSGFLDGQRFMESFIESRAERGLGPVRIRSELIQRGIANVAAADALEAAGKDWRALAAAVRAKRFGAEPPREFRERARQARFLEYRGFRAADIDAALELGADSD
ncbi:MAG: regulatory protein RecX [Gammaproteobacteria bacterium]|nr:regulatory protein RecX [Gammaproteobacteria bacterium]